MWIGGYKLRGNSVTRRAKLARFAAPASLFFVLMVYIPCTWAQSETVLLQGFRSQANDLARRQYLVQRIPDLSEFNRSFAQQLLSTVDSELGMYDWAIRDFPFDNRIALRGPLPWEDQSPDAAAYESNPVVSGAGNIGATDAADAIAKLAAKRRIVLVNEAHDDAHTRVLVLALLPRLRALGYDYFAAEALTENGLALMKRRYPVEASGTEYLREPIYGDILRQAIRLGYTIVNYDPIQPVADRDDAQAKNLYRQVFAGDPRARLFAMVGYAHLDKAKGHLGTSVPMAMRLQKLTDIDPLSIDQTQFRDVEPSPHNDPYHQMIEVLHPTRPVVLLLRGGGKLWSSDPARYDVSVILPSPHGPMRPDWLSLDGQRHQWPISPVLCNGVVPCVVEAHYNDEPDDAIPADRYTFLDKLTTSVLYLRPGTYRLRAWSSDGRTLSQRIIRVAEQ